jgi:putative transposase
MARLPRLAIDHELHLLVHRCAPGVVLTAHDDDRRDLHDALLTVSREADVAIHAYSFLPDRLLLLLTPRQGAALSGMMQRLGRRVAGSYNRRHQHIGSPWQGRFGVSVLQASTCLMDGMCLVETAADRQGLTLEPGAWSASSAPHHLGRSVDLLIAEHPRYWLLGNTPFDREAAYRHLFLTPLSPARIRELEEASLKGWAVGEDAHIAQLAKRQARRLQPGKPGRPRAPLLGDPL